MEFSEQPIYISNNFTLREKLKIIYNVLFKEVLVFYIPTPLQELRKKSKDLEIEIISAEIE